MSHERLAEPSAITVDDFARQLVENPEQLAVYDYAKWNLLGHANRELRFAGHHPWPKRTDSEGNTRTLSVPVFSGFSAESETLLVVRKDPWTEVKDPQSWLVAEQHLPTGEYSEERILSVNVDAWNQMWLQVAPEGYGNWPAGRHPAHFQMKRDQHRLQTTLDELYHAESITFRGGLYQAPRVFSDLELLETAIVHAQRERATANEERRQATIYHIGERGVAFADAV